MTTLQSTCLTLLTTAATRGGLTSVLDPLDAIVMQGALNELNFMLDAWSSELGPLYNIIDSQYQASNPGFTLIGGQPQYVIGTNTIAGQLLGVRPTKILDVHLIDGNGVTYY